MNRRRLTWLLLAAALCVAAAIRFRLLDLPLERDEGEYAYIGSLWLQGVPPFAEAWNLKLPGSYAVYALLLAVGGSSVTAIHAGLLAASVWNALACFLLGRRLFGDAAGLVAGAGYAGLSLSPWLLGLWSHAEPFALSLVLAAVLLLVGRESRLGACVAAGLALGAAVLVKQNAAPFALFAAGWVAWRAPRGLRLRRVTELAFAVALPGLLMLAYLFWQSAIHLEEPRLIARFWFWTWSYARAYAGESSLGEGLAGLLGQLEILAPAQGLFWLAASLSLYPLWRERRPELVFAAGLWAAGALGASFGLHFRPQYFVLPLPGLLLLATAGVQSLARERAALALACAALVALALPICVDLQLLLRSGPTAVMRSVYGRNPFPEARELGRLIAEHAPPEARIAVIGSEPELYFYAQRRAVTGYMYTYPLVESQPYALEMQQEFIAQIEAARPELLVFVNVDLSWLASPGSPSLVFDWFRRYQAQHYEPIAYADIVSLSATRYVSGDEARGFTPRSDHWLALLRRRPE